jgi:hypothetical protein
MTESRGSRPRCERVAPAERAGDETNDKNSKRIQNG